MQKKGKQKEIKFFKYNSRMPSFIFFFQYSSVYGNSGSLVGSSSLGRKLKSKERPALLPLSRDSREDMSESDREKSNTSKFSLMRCWNKEGRR